MSGNVIAEKVAADMGTASWIREMFERGRRLKAELGAENVFDFSLGNPSAPPPPEYFDALQAVAAERDGRLHRYMPNAGFEATRTAVARFLTREYQREFDAAGVIMTSGAAGGMNVALRAICDPGDEIIVLAPYFPEYRFYIEQAGARMVLVQTDDAFQPDPQRIAAAFTPRTRGLIVNTPNNPTGVVFSRGACQALADTLAEHDRPQRPLYLLADEPYRRLVYDVERADTPATMYPRTILISSFSKDLSIAGERAGYIALSASVPHRETLVNAMTMLNRTLGFVNAAAVTQRVVARCVDARCDIDYYRQRRDKLCHALRSFGYAFQTPGGGMFVFPRTPTEDDVAFVDLLLEQRILAVPGRGFGRAGHIRLSFATDLEVIERSLPGFEAAIRRAR